VGILLLIFVLGVLLILKARIKEMFVLEIMIVRIPENAVHFGLTMMLQRL
jgi:hypothetical protein